MTISRYPELRAFLSTHFMDSDPEKDEETVRSFARASSPERQEQVIGQLRLFLETDLSVEEIGTESNRWFADSGEAGAWLRHTLELLETAHAPSIITVKDCNGLPLSEGDSVQVIKDLKVKGGSSDLKRGTLIKKIHLTGETEAVECRVDGSTLVLKTCFLKKVGS